MDEHAAAAHPEGGTWLQPTTARRGRTWPQRVRIELRPLRPRELAEREAHEAQASPRRQDPERHSKWLCRTPGSVAERRGAPDGKARADFRAEQLRQP